MHPMYLQVNTCLLLSIIVEICHKKVIQVKDILELNVLFLLRAPLLLNHVRPHAINMEVFHFDEDMGLFPIIVAQVLC